MRHNEDAESEDRRLVHVLDHDYRDQELRFESLQSKHSAIADLLTRFCESTDGKYTLCLVKAKYVSSTYPDGDDEEISVTLENPWFVYGQEGALTIREDVSIDPEEEVAPVGILEEFEFDDCDTDYTDGVREDAWHTKAVLVVQPKHFHMKLLANTDVTSFVSMLEKLVGRRSDQAVPLASQFLARSPSWSSESREFVQCLDLLPHLEEARLIEALFKRVLRWFYQPAVAGIIKTFGWERSRGIVMKFDHMPTLRSRMNLACSLLHGTADAAQIAEILKKLDLTLTTIPSKVEATQSRFDRLMNQYLDPTTEEVTRVLDLHHRVSVDTLMQYFEPMDEVMLITLAVPALVSFVKSLSDSSSVQSLVQDLRDKLKGRLPTLRNEAYARVDLRAHCDVCCELERFLSHESMHMTVVTATNKPQAKHLESVLKRINRTAKLTVENVGETLTRQVTKQPRDTQYIHDVLNAIASLAALVPPAP